MSALDELVAAWRANPDAAATISLCSALGAIHRGAKAHGLTRDEVMREIAGVAEQWHPENAEVQLALGRMFLDVGQLAEAQAHLVSAGKADRTKPDSFRFLGEVLLRRGDAARSKKVFARAMQLGANDSETKLWHDRAAVYVPLQERRGPGAVAAEIARTAPLPHSVPPPPRKAPGAPAPRAIPAPSAVPTIVDAVEKAQPGASRTITDWPQTSRIPSVLPPPRSVPPPSASAWPPAAVSSLPPPSLPPPAFGAPAGGLRPAPSPFPSASGASAPPFATIPAPSASKPSFAGGASSSDWDEAAVAVPTSAPPISPPMPMPSAPPPRGPGESLGRVAPEPDAPSAEEVLAHLAQVGVYEIEGGAAPAWERPPREKSRALWVLVAFAVVAGGAAIGGTIYAKKVRGREIAEARDIGERVSAVLHAGHPGELQETDELLGQAFDLDPASQFTARLWLENRVMHFLVNGEARGIEGAIQRAASVGVPPATLAVGNLAAALAQGDIPSALVSIPKRDPIAKEDALYQLLTAIVFERVGRAEALTRYDAAVRLDEKLQIAKLLRARAILLMKGPGARDLALQGIDESSPEGAALLLLVAALGGEVEGVDNLAEEVDVEELPVPLRSVPSLFKAHHLLEGAEGDEGEAQKRREQGKKLLAEGIARADTPDLSARLGELALRVGDTETARKAAAKTIGLSPLHQPGRLLVARVALRRGQPAEAVRALEGLDAKLPEAIAIRAVAAYEAGNVIELGDLSESLANREKPEFAAVPLLLPLLTGRPVQVASDVDLAAPEMLWGDVAAADLALRNGNAKVAEAAIRAAFGESPATSAGQLRVSRLARLRGDTERALLASEAAFEKAPGPLTLLERVRALVLAEQAPRAKEVLDAAPAILGPMTDWLRVWVDAARDQGARAKARAATLEEPSEESLLALRSAVAEALVAVGDRTRGRPLVLDLRRAASRDPDVRNLPTRF